MEAKASAAGTVAAVVAATELLPREERERENKDKTIFFFLCLFLTFALRTLNLENERRLSLFMTSFFLFGLLFFHSNRNHLQKNEFFKSYFVFDARGVASARTFTRASSPS